MIYNVGLLSESNLEYSREAYKHYRNRNDNTRPNKLQSSQFREKHQCKMPSIHFLGCFDTVGALGVPRLPWYLGGSLCKLNPLVKFIQTNYLSLFFLVYGLFSGLHEFHDTKLSPIIKNAYHAISIHEQREWFRPTFMQSPPTEGKHRLEQVWFPGMHGDIGGQEELGAYNNLISYHSLNWMMSKATENGLKFKPADDINKKTQFVYHDSYLSSFIYKLMPRDDRVIQEEDSMCCTVSQLYKHGQFDEFITPEQLAMYKSKTLKSLYTRIQQEKQII